MAGFLEVFPDTHMMIEAGCPAMDAFDIEDETFADVIMAIEREKGMHPLSVEEICGSMAVYTASFGGGAEVWELAGFLRQSNERYPRIGIKDIASLNYDVSELGSLWVAPDFRRQGVGTELIRSATHTARHNGLTPFAICNEPGQAVFESFGYTPVGEVGDEVIEIYPPDFGEYTGMLKIWYAGIADFVGGVIARYAEAREA